MIFPILIGYTIGRIVGTIVGLVLKLVFMTLVLLGRFVWWLIGPVTHPAVETETTRPPYTPMHQRPGRVLGEDGFGCVMGEDWDDGGWRRGPESPDPGPPTHGVEKPHVA